MLGKRWGARRRCRSLCGAGGWEHGGCDGAREGGRGASVAGGREDPPYLYTRRAGEIEAASSLFVIVRTSFVMASTVVRTSFAMATACGSDRQGATAP